jgi:hypothetical protein
MAQTRTKNQSSPKRGRPASTYGAKKNRSLSLSNVAYEELQKVANQHGTSSISELMEKVGHQELVIEDLSQRKESSSLFGNIPIFGQLQSFVEKRNGALCSTLAFTTKISGQMGLSQKPDFLSDVILDAMTTLFCLSYLVPNKTIDSPTAWLRWYLIHILENHARRKNPQLSSVRPRIRYKTDDNLTEKCISIIFQARKELAENPHKVAHLQALKLRTPPYELSISQIELVFKAQDVPETGFELVSRGMDTLRRLWMQEGITQADIPPRTRERLARATEYCSLLRQPTLNDENIKQLKHLVKDGLYYPDYDWWANEIDFFVGCRTCENHDDYEADAKMLHLRIRHEFEKVIASKKLKIDRELLDMEMAKGLKALLEDEASKSLGFSTPPANSMTQIINPEKHTTTS